MIAIKNLFKREVKGDNILQVYTFILSGIYAIGVKLWKGEKIILLIRQAEIRDLPAILEIYNDAIRNLAATFDLAEQTLDAREEWFKKFGDKYPLIVAEIDGEIAGYCGLSPYNQKAAFAKTVELSIYLSDRHRGKGTGKALMEEILTKGKQMGFHTVISGITAGNDVSVKMHEKFGFKIAGRLKEVGYKFGQWHDVIYMQLLFK
jgi:L-amino acid N-acyltransferase